MRETRHFINDGYGWTCKRCRSQSEPDADAPAAAHNTRADGNAPADPDDASACARFFREGEAEEREPRLSAPALARWLDPTHRTLVCPRCGITEGMRDEG